MKKKLIAFSLITTLLLGTVPVYAANSTDENGSVQSQVIAQVASSWVVTVPATINIGAENNANYEVIVRGDVANDTSVSVIPDATITLTDGESTTSASVTQSKQQWLGSEVTSEGVSTVGNIAIGELLTAGTWAGQLNFTVNCTENLGDLLAKIALMNQIDLYVMGDSIMDGMVGYRESLYGMAEAIDNLYGVNIFKNYAVTGAYLTDFNPHLPNIIQQSNALKVRMHDGYEYNEHSVIVFDGGGNDIVYLTENGDSAEISMSDVGTAFFDVLENIEEIFEEANADYSTPVIYIIPKTRDYDDKFEEVKRGIENYNTMQNLIVIDCREFITEADLVDSVHLTKAGQTKLAHKIVDEIYNFYNNQP